MLTTKEQIRNPKSEIRNNFKGSKSKYPKRWRTSGVGHFEIVISVIRACFGFRVSNFGFPARLLVLMILTLCVPGRADVMESARMLPDDMLVMVSVESVKDLQAAGEKTSLYGLYKDPAMQPFVTETEKKIHELINTTLKDFWQKMQIENPPEQLPYPEGRLVLGVSLFQPAGPGAGNSGPVNLGFRFAVLADMGSRVEQTRQMIRSLTASATNAGTTVQKTSVGGLEFNVIVPDEDSGDPTLYYALKDNWLVVTGNTAKDAAFTESIVRRMGRSVPGSLADKAGFKSAVNTLGAAQFFAFVNTDVVKSLIAGVAPDKAQVEQIIKGLGFENVTGLTMAVQVAGQKNQESVSKMLIGVNGPKTGIPALLGDASGPLKLNARLLPRDAVGFVSANYEPAKIFDGLSKIVQGIVGMDLNMLSGMAMGATAGEGGQPPVQLRDDVLAQTGSPLFATWRMEKPYTLTSATKFLVGLSVKDAERLNTALGRIHQAFLRGQADMSRELLDRTIYLLPSGGPDAANQTMALSVAGDQLVFGQVDGVEQAIRSLQREPQDSLLSDPMFRYAKESLPSQACLYAYQNGRLNGEISWTALKQMAKDMSGQDQADASWNPMTMAMQKIKEYVDLSKLPEFKAVEKYWGPSIGYMQSRPEGLYWESIALRPPQQ